MYVSKMDSQFLCEYYKFFDEFSKLDMEMAEYTEFYSVILEIRCLLIKIYSDIAFAITRLSSLDLVDNKYGKKNDIVQTFLSKVRNDFKDTTHSDIQLLDILIDRLSKYKYPIVFKFYEYCKEQQKYCSNFEINYKTN